MAEENPLRHFTDFSNYGNFTKYFLQMFNIKKFFLFA
jgi:hypothetical protein